MSARTAGQCRRGRFCGAVNGLTDEFLHANGADIAVVLEQYREEILRGLVLVAYNAQYDLKVMRGEMRRAGVPDLFEQTKTSA